MQEWLFCVLPSILHISYQVNGHSMHVYVFVPFKDVSIFNH